MSSCYLRKCYKCGQPTRDLEKHLYYVYRIIPLDERPDHRETPSHGGEPSQRQLFELPGGCGGPGCERGSTAEG
ncbi:hypothetical protein GN956_G12882 [Arapaima gigas]